MRASGVTPHRDEEDESCRLAAIAAGSSRLCVGAAAGKQTGRRKEGDGEVHEKSLEMSHFRVFRTWRRQSWLLPKGRLSRWGCKEKKTVPTQAIGSILAAGRKDKMEIPLYCKRKLSLYPTPGGASHVVWR